MTEVVQKPTAWEAEWGTVQDGWRAYDWNLSTGAYVFDGAAIHLYGFSSIDGDITSVIVETLDDWVSKAPVTFSFTLYGAIGTPATWTKIKVWSNEFPTDWPVGDFLGANDLADLNLLMAFDGSSAGGGPDNPDFTV